MRWGFLYGLRWRVEMEVNSVWVDRRAVKMQVLKQIIVRDEWINQIKMIGDWKRTTVKSTAKSDLMTDYYLTSNKSSQFIRSMNNKTQERYKETLKTG